MAIENRNLAEGTKLWARYKGEVYTAEVVHVFPGGEESTKAETRYRLTLTGETKDYKSPSAAGAAIMGEGRTCNGWAFWSTGEPVEKPAKEPKAPRQTSVNPVPKPERNGRGRKPKADAADQSSNEPTGETPSDETAAGAIECGQCGAILPNAEAAAAHIDEVHSA